MEQPPATQLFFHLLDKNLDYYAKNIRNRVFSEFKDMPWTHEQRLVLQPIIRKELDSLIWRVLGNFDNVGGVIPNNPDEIIGYNISVQVWEDEPEVEFSDGYKDYSDMWHEYLFAKAAAEEATP